MGWWMWPTRFRKRRSGKFVWIFGLVRFLVVLWCNHCLDVYQFFLHCILPTSINIPNYRYYSEFMISKETDSSCTSSSKPLIRVKVIPASFGLEAFEDAVWEATQDLIPRTSMVAKTKKSTCKAITFVVASPDLSDPILTEKNGGCSKTSSQAEFASDTFLNFALTLHEKLKMFSRMEGVALDDLIEVRAFHPLWKDELVESFPYPCVAISTEVEMEKEAAVLP